MLSFTSLGLSFWKVGSRKFFAVTVDEIERQKEIDEFEDEVQRPMETRKRKRENEENSTDENLSYIKDKVDKLFSLASKHHFSAGFLRAPRIIQKC